MGLYAIDCPQCKKPFMWFSGNHLDQRCHECKNPKIWYIQEASEGYSEFVTIYSPEYLEKNHPKIAKERDDAGRWIQVIEKSAFDAQFEQMKALVETYHELLKSHVKLQNLYIELSHDLYDSKS